MPVLGIHPDESVPEPVAIVTAEDIWSGQGLAILTGDGDGVTLIGTNAGAVAKMAEQFCERIALELCTIAFTGIELEITVLLNVLS